MPLQNRVTPFGDVVALSGRGLMMGNRGVLHDERRRIVRQSAVKRWIACVLEFGGRRRAVMTPRRYTELFFLDEAAAFAAGHRPCAECRREDYRRFQSAWKKSVGGVVDADAMDAVLHAQRLDGKKKRTYRAELASLPDGTYVVWNGDPHLVWGSDLFQWSDSGYTKRVCRPARHEIEVLTPRAIVEVFAAGYRPTIHPSAASQI
jgi:hypothetical protein